MSPWNCISLALEMFFLPSSRKYGKQGSGGRLGTCDKSLPPQLCSRVKAGGDGVGEGLESRGAAGQNTTQNKPQVNFETGGSFSCPGEGLASAGALRRRCAGKPHKSRGWTGGKAAISRKHHPRAAPAMGTQRVCTEKCKF